MIRAHAFLGVLLVFTLAGPLLRVWRFDPQSYCCSRAIDLSKPGCTAQLVRFVALISNTASCMTKLQPSGSFVVQPYDAETRSVQEWEWEETPSILDVRNQIFGRRTCCFGGRARQVAGLGNQYQDVVLKLCWLPSYLIKHEASILHHLNSRNVSRIPLLLGSLAVDDAWADVTASSRFVKRMLDEGEETAGSAHGLCFESVVSLCPIGSKIGPHTSFETLLMMHETLAPTLLAINIADVRYRDFNTGNLLLSPSLDSVLLVDYGNSRIYDRARGVSREAPCDAVRLAADDLRCVNSYFACVSSLKAAQVLSSLKRAVYTNEKWKQKSDHQATYAPLIRKQENNIKRYRLELAGLAHRPLDELESAFWCFLWALAVTFGHNGLEALQEMATKTMILDDPDSVFPFIVDLLVLDGDVFLILDPLLTTLANTISTESRADIVSKAKGSLKITEEERVAFETWRNAFATARQSVQELNLALQASELTLEPSSAGDWDLLAAAVQTVDDHVEQPRSARQLNREPVLTHSRAKASSSSSSDHPFFDAHDEPSSPLP